MLERATSRGVGRLRRSRAGGARKYPVRYQAGGSFSPALARALRAHRKGDRLGAVTDYRAALEEAPSCLDAWMNLGSLLAWLGRGRDAAEAFRCATNLEPADARVWRDVGIGLASIGSLEPACHALERSIHYDPTLVGSWLHLARLQLETDRRQDAIATAARAVALRSSDPSTHLELARAHFRHETPREALAALAEARRGAPARWDLELLQIAYACADTDSGESQPASYIEERLARLAVQHEDARHEVNAVSYLLRSMRLARLFSSSRELLRFACQKAERSGLAVELGVRHGVSLRGLRAFWTGVLHGFDSFEGLPESWNRVAAGSFSTHGEVPDVDGANIWVGRFEDQLPIFCAHNAAPIALLHIDSDLYASAKVGLRHLGPKLGAGSVLVFDEYFGHRDWQHGEYLAFQEACGDFGWRYEYLAANPFTGQAAVRLAG